MASTSTSSTSGPSITTTTTNNNNNDDNDYCRLFLSPEIVEKLEAGAFRSLCQHLQERSDQVPNMELMTLSGFCRNCLAKWMVLEARRLVDSNEISSSLMSQKKALDAFGYEEAANHVYGMPYGEWKQRYQAKATDEQIQRYEASRPLQAVHDHHRLQSRADRPTTTTLTTTTTTTKAKATSSSSALSSNVCCENFQEDDETTNKNTATTTSTRVVPPFQPPPLPDKRCFTRPLVIGILTVSDRASRNQYASGDLSGPSVQAEVQTILQSTSLSCPAVISTAIVADEAKDIVTQLITWSEETENSSAMDIILTTGGTGMSVRDVTPEATRAVLSTECPGLMNFILAECAQQHRQPLASLSRATAGIRNQTVIANLPGNPKAVSEIVPLLLPLLLHVVVDLQGWQKP